MNTAPQQDRVRPIWVTFEQNPRYSSSWDRLLPFTYFAYVERRVCFSDSPNSLKSDPGQLRRSL